MPNSCTMMAVWGILLVFSMIDENVALTPGSFQLTYKPAHVVKHVTELIAVGCAHEDDNAVSQLQEISRIRILKKSATGWKLLAEIRDNEATPKTHINVSVSARISSNIRDNFIEIVWPVASDDTFGIYRCDVIGFENGSFLNKAEVAPLIQILEDNVTTSDMLDMFLQTKAELHQIEDDEKRLEGNVGSLSNKVSYLSQEVHSQSEDVSELIQDMSPVHQSLKQVESGVALLKVDVAAVKPKIESANENRIKLDEINANMESVRYEISSLRQGDSRFMPSAGSFEILMGWPAGRFALLQPKTGCPVDLTFYGGDVKYWQIHTESSSSSSNRNAHSDVFLPDTLSTVDKNNFATLKFCEANGLLNTGSWPSGSYCINRIFDVSCPGGFLEGEIQLDVEDTNVVTDYTSRSVLGGHSILFCCMNSGNSQIAIVLPTHTPFLLYRHGGQCQKVKGMGVSEETIILDTENTVNGDHKVDSWPDVDIHLSGDSIMTMHLCHYTQR